MSIESIVNGLIDARKEGTFWDFKSKWHDGGDLLQDIVSLANNIDNDDAYLIFGISDDFLVNGVESAPFNENRKTSASLTQFINSAPFGDGNRPSISLHTITLNNHQVDVIRIKASNKVPFFLSNVHQGLQAGVVYSRRNDVNTGKGSATPSDMVEKLYRIRFGLDKTIMERMHILLDEFDNWGCYSKGIYHDWKSGGDWGNIDYIFHKAFPEFKIQIVNEGQKWDKEPLMCFYLGNHFVQYHAVIMYHSTTIYEFEIVALEEYRKYIPIPRIDSLISQKAKNDSGHDELVRFYYETKDSIDGKILKILTKGSYDTSARCLFQFENEWLLTFNNIDELEQFKDFANHNQQLFNPSLSNIQPSVELERGLPLWPTSDIIQARTIYIVWLNSR